MLCYARWCNLLLGCVVQYSVLEFVVNTTIVAAMTIVYCLTFTVHQDKIAAGADFVLTQFFYDTQMFIKYLTKCREAHITCPIIPGER